MANRNKKIAKAYAITNANISFVSLVDKAANKHQFLITKAEEGNASFQTFGRILKADTETHYVTGIVYEPMVEDTQGNYMTEDEIVKAAYGYAKNGMNADLQHNFVAMEGAAVVESYVAKCDEVINGQNIKKGTWVMTMEITDSQIFEAIQKGDITGFSMGGVGQYSCEDVQLGADEPVEKKGILNWVAKKMGLVEKGAVKDNYISRITHEAFWEAFYALNDVLFRWDRWNDNQLIERNPEVIQEALADFNMIVTDILSQTDTGEIAKSVEGIAKSGKQLSAANKKTLESIHANLGDFLSQFKENEEEEIEVTKAEIEEIVKSAVTTAIAATQTAAPVNPVAKAAEPVPEDGKITKADIQGMIDASIKKALGAAVPADPEELEEQEEPSMQEAITKAVADAMAPFMKQAGLPTNLNPLARVEKEEQHYLHGFI